MAWEFRWSVPRRNQVIPQLKRLALVARRASALHSRNIFAKKNSVCGGRRSAHEWSLMYLFVFLRVSISTANLYSVAGRSMRTAKGGHLICNDATPLWMWSRVFYLPPARLPYHSEERPWHVAELSCGQMSIVGPGHLVIDDESRVPSITLDALTGLRRLVVRHDSEEARDLRRVNETSTVEQAWDECRHRTPTVAEVTSR